MNDLLEAFGITKEDLQYTFDAADEALKIIIKKYPEILVK